jgi:hypothetical protein
LALLVIALSIVFAVPAQAQFHGDFGGPPFSDDFQMAGDPMGMGPFGMDMPFMPPFMGMHGRQSEWVMPVTRLPVYPGGGDDLMATMESTQQLSLFTAALKAAGHGEKLKGQGNYVVFAPSDKAIMRDMSVKDARALVSDAGLVKGLAENCIVHQPAGHRPDNGKAFVALNGKEIKMLRSKSGVTANGADVLNYYGASNGVVVVTDGAVGT